MDEGMRSSEDLAVIEAESKLVELIGGATRLSTLQQMLAGFASEEAGGGLRAIETSTHIFSRQAEVISQLQADITADGVEAAIARFPEVSSGEIVTEKYGIALKVQEFLDKKALREKGDAVDLDLSEKEVDLVI